MKKTIKLIPAIVMLLVSAILVSTSTYAWFSMNNRVTVTGMTITTKVDNNLLIAPSSASSDDKAADSAFTKALNQAVTGTLQPTSTINAADAAFYYTYDAKANGSKATATAQVPYTLVEDNDIVINTTHYKAYVDYVFELKAINAGSSTQKVNLTKLNLLYAGAPVTEHAYRVAVFVQEESTPGASTYAARGTNAGYIFAPTSFAYFTANSAVNSTTTVAAVDPVVNSAKVALDVTAGQTKYFKVTVRLWLEGEDTDCYNTKFVDLTDDWRLDLAFALEANDTNAVQLIGSEANLPAATAAGAVGTASFSMANETVLSQQWYKVVVDGDDTAVPSATALTYTATETGNYYCEFTTINGTKYRTNTVTLTVPVTP